MNNMRVNTMKQYSICVHPQFLTTFLIHMPLNLTYLLGSTVNALYSHTVIKYDFCISI